MKTTALAILLAVPFIASAQGFAPLRLADSGDVCYSWSGDTRTSAGSFSRCSPFVYVAPPKPTPVVATPVAAPAPIIMQSCPPPAATPVVKPKRKPPVKC